MDYFGLINSVLQKELTPDSYVLWEAMTAAIDPVWDRKSSSSGKYHKRADGTVPSIAEHTAEMLIAAVKTVRLFPKCNKKGAAKDAILLGVAFHDAIKYGVEPSKSHHTVSNHDKLARDFVADIRDIVEECLGAYNTCVLEECLNYHSGQWSTALQDFDQLPKESLYVHFLDMLSTADLLNISNRDIAYYME